MASALGPLARFHLNLTKRQSGFKLSMDDAELCRFSEYVDESLRRFGKSSLGNQNGASRDRNVQPNSAVCGPLS